MMFSPIAAIIAAYSISEQWNKHQNLYLFDRLPLQEIREK